ncbi:MAG: ParA family protein [Oscillospiraceae bacterium]|nr:ParA family protein [Oscillospiraceae bacterium]
MKECKVTALTNQKGGIGKTTSAVNLGIGLAKQGERVLLVDADPQASLTICLGIRIPDELETSLASVMQSVIEEKPPPDGYGIIAHEEGVDLLPANIELSAFEVSLTNVMSREYVLREALEPLRERYDRILIDCMPSLGMMTINALVAADSAIIPSQANYLSTKGLSQLMQLIAKVKRQINPRLKIDGVLLTMVDNRTNNAKSIISALRQTGSALRVFDTEIPYSVRAAETTSEGKSIFAYDARGKVAEAYGNLAKEVIDHERREANRARSQDRIR